MVVATVIGLYPRILSVAPLVPRTFLLVPRPLDIGPVQRATSAHEAAMRTLSAAQPSFFLGSRLCAKPKAY